MDRAAADRSVLFWLRDCVHWMDSNMKLGSGSGPQVFNGSEGATIPPKKEVDQKVVLSPPKNQSLIRDGHGGSVGNDHNCSAEEIAEKPEIDCFKYDAFISFRGEDTRNGFTSHLYKELESHGITTFFDSENLEVGQRISHLMHCIEGSKIFVPVLSKNYADSRWCLKEIAKMVQINKKNREKRPIIPIFYDVHPSDVKFCRASFEKAFKKHRHNNELDKKIVNEWEAALTEAGNISGYCLSKAEGNEAKLITPVRTRISSILSKVPFDIKPVGVDSQLVHLKQMLEREEDGVCMIGICGLGGIGKTTIAMDLHNQFYPTFEGSCFLSDIREHENRLGLPSLQAKLLKDVLKETMSIDNVREGVSLIKRRLGSKKVLLILDDVDHKRQLEAFTANRREKHGEWFMPGSKIIVTTRNREVLLQYGLQEEEIHFLEGLSAEHSLQLFCRHAFGRNRPLTGLGELSQEIVEVAGGLPLALQIFGSHFSFLKKKQDWEETLRTLKSEQNKEVHERLRITYEGLNGREKCIFLDIACFFIGEYKESPVYMWEGCGWNPHLTLEVLQHRSLIQIDKFNCFVMHDQIRDMGRMIADQGGHMGVPLTHSRPWSKDQVLQVALGNRDLHGVDFSTVVGERLWKVIIAAMPRPRMITGATQDALEAKGEIVRLPGNIRWFSWKRCPYKTLTFQNSRHEQLIVLDLSNGRLQDFGSRMAFPELKVLDLTWCINLIRTPDFTYLPSIEKLVLDYCVALIETDESIRHLNKLVKLSMEGCSKLKGLPDGLWEMTSLEYLDLSGCEQISCLPEQIGDLKSLKYLNLGETGISYLPDSIVTIQLLENLDLHGCKRISLLPKQIGDLKSLKYLGVSQTSISDIPDSIGRLQSLEQLDLTDCPYLRQIPDSVGGLESLLQLRLTQCKLLERIPNSVTKLTTLKKLDIRNCQTLTEVPDSLGDLNNELKLSLDGCISLENVPSPMVISISRVHDELQFKGLKSLRRLPASLGNMKSIRRLSFRDCESLEELPESISRLAFLEDLDLSGCISLRNIPKSMGEFRRLNRLSLKHCRSLEELPESIGRLQSLRVLHISGGRSVKKVPDFLGKLKNLLELHLREVEEISKLVGGLPRLAEMWVEDCPKLESIPLLPSSLAHLSVLRCPALTHLSGLGNLKSLNELILTHCNGLGRDFLEKLSQDASLEQLDRFLISGVNEGSDLVFWLPKWEFKQPVKARLICSIQEPNCTASQINVCVQVKVEGEIITESRWVAVKFEELILGEKLERWGVDAMVPYAIEFEEDEENFRYVKEGRATLRVRTACDDYQLKAAYFAVL